MAKHPAHLYRAIVDTLDDSLALIDGRGSIVFVNQSWIDFCRGNAGNCADDYLNANYLAVCDTAARRGDEDSRKAASGLRALIAGRIGHFEMEYPCHSPDQERWFILTASPLRGVFPTLYLISHKNITRRKQAEQEVLKRSLTDQLTGLANRRQLDLFLGRQWRSHARAGKSLAMVLLDIDDFKRYNDHYGHSAGDDCLRQVAQALSHVAQRPDDLCARIGGEEFLLVLGDTDAGQAFDRAREALDAIRALGIPHAASRCSDIVTASLGVAASCPDADTEPSQLIETADRALYDAKQAGRDQIRVNGMQEPARQSGA